MNKIMMALMPVVLLLASGAVLAEDDPADVTNSDAALGADSAVPSESRPFDETHGPNAHASGLDALPGPNDSGSIPEARAAASSPDRAGRH